MISLTLKPFWLIEAVLQRRVHYIKTKIRPLAHKGQQYFVPIELFLIILHTLSQVLKPLLGGTGDVKPVGASRL
jgi:hypothetical protein